MRFRKQAVAVLLLASPSVAPAEPTPSFRVLNEPHAQGVVVIELRIAGERGPGDWAALSVLFPRGKSVVGMRSGPHSGNWPFPIEWGADDAGTVARAVLAGHRGITRNTESAWIFDSAGQYELHFTAHPCRADDPPDESVYAIDILPPNPQDRAFLVALGDTPDIRTILIPEGSEPSEELIELLDRGPSEDRGQLVLESVFQAIATQHPWDIARVSAISRSWVARTRSLRDALASTPESSFAPYAAWFVGCRHMGEVVADKRRSAWDRSRRVDPEHQAYRAARECLLFAVARGDDFLKPRALLALAWCEYLVGEAAEADGHRAAALQIALPGSPLSYRLRELGPKAAIAGIAP